MGFLGDEKKSFFGKLQQKIQDVILMRPEIDEETFDELEEALITSDIGMETTMRITDRLRQDIKKMKLHEPKEVQERLKEIIKELINLSCRPLTTLRQMREISRSSERTPASRV